MPTIKKATAKKRGQMQKTVHKQSSSSTGVETSPLVDLAKVLEQVMPIAGSVPRDGFDIDVVLPDDYKRDIEKSIQDEIADTGFYACIVNEAPNPILRLLSQSITGEEFGHARTQAAIISANPPPVSPPEPVECSGNFAEDVARARQGEVAAITRYADLAARAPTPELRYLFTSILTDEYAHSRIWAAMLQSVTGFE